VAVVVGTTHLLVPAVARVVVVVERARYKRPRHLIRETSEAKANMLPVLVTAAAAVGGELGPLVQQVQTAVVEMAVPALTTLASSELIWVIVEGLPVVAQVRPTELVALQSRRAALEGEVEKVAVEKQPPVEGEEPQEAWALQAVTEAPA
jgi:hypothetical protein